MSDIRPEAVEAVAESLALHAGRGGDVLAFIRDAIHRDGDDADAIREALGLYRECSKSYDYHGPTRHRAVGEWREVQP